MAKKREDRSSTGTATSFESPFAKLQSLRDKLSDTLEGNLPEGPTVDPVREPARRAPSPLGGKIVVRRERAGRGGKTVTVIEGVALQGEERSAFVSDLKKALGCGASVDGDAIVLQGEQDERARDLLLAKGATRVVLGSQRGRSLEAPQSRK